MADRSGHSTLAVHPGALGDVVLFGHLLASLGEPVTLVAGGEKARLLAEAGLIARALDFDLLPMHEAFADTPLAECRLPELLGPHDRLVSCLAGGDERAERRLAELCGAADAAFLPTRPPADYPAHLVSLWAELLGDRLAGEVAPADWSVPPDRRREADELLAGAGLPPDRPYVAVHPGAGAEAKCWPVERYIAAADALRADGLGVLFALGPVERERWRDGRLDRLREAHAVLVCSPLAALAAVLAGAAGYVGNDSGVTHLAAAVGAPTVALFGPTSPVHFRPLGRRVEVVAAPRMEAVETPRVLAAVRRALPAGHA